MERKKPYRKPEALKQFENELFEIKKVKFKEQPGLLKQTFRDDSANGLTKCIIKFIQLRGGQAERISTTGRVVDNRQTYVDVIGFARTMGSVEWIPSNTTKGSADIAATVKGRSVKIEVKIGNDRQSEAQKQYQSEIEKAGGIYYIARDFTTFIEWYTKLLSNENR